MGAIDETREQIEELEATMRRPSFEFNRYSEWADADLIVLDEVSMVHAKMAEAIERFGVPVLVLGDPEQLPPIEGGGYYTTATPDVLLTEVHRQALQSPVYRLATQIREGRGWTPVPVSLAAAMEADQIICWKNSTRWNLIHKIREKLGRPKEWPVPGDRIMCLVNNKDAGVLNGQQFDVLNVRRDGEDWSIDARDDEGHMREILAYADGFLGFEREKAGRDTLRAFRGARGLFTFANVVTCHKAQGSEWDHVYVVDQTHQMWKSSEAEKRRWCYTAVSRASERVTIARAGA
jgi:exodeoxyribonuclease-5